MLRFETRQIVANLLPTAALLLTSAAASAATPTYKDVANILAANCASCHGADIAYADVLLDSEASVVANAAKAVEEIEAGAMPAGDPTFGATAEGKALIAYLKSVAK